jgi:hypothetical protein
MGERRERERTKGREGGEAERYEGFEEQIPLSVQTSPSTCSVSPVRWSPAMPQSPTTHRLWVLELQISIKNAHSFPG